MSVIIPLLDLVEVSSLILWQSHEESHQLLHYQNHLAISVCLKQNLTSIEMPQSPEHVQLSRVKEVVGSPHSSNPAVVIEFFALFAAA